MKQDGTPSAVPKRGSMFTWVAQYDMVGVAAIFAPTNSPLATAADLTKFECSSGPANNGSIKLQINMSENKDAKTLTNPKLLVIENRDERSMFTNCNNNKYCCEKTYKYHSVSS
jgi:hypothetical protein